MIMQAMARSVFNEGFIQFISTMIIDELESSNHETFWAHIVNFPINCLGLQFDECCFIYNKINQVEDFKERNYKFLLLGLVKKNEDGAEETEEIVLSPLYETVTAEYQALILWNHAEMVPVLESNQFTDMVHILKLKYFHGTIESPK